MRVCAFCALVFISSFFIRFALWCISKKNFETGTRGKSTQTPHKIPPHPPAHINAANTVQRKILRRCLRVQVRFHSSSRERAIGIGITRSHLPGKRGELRRFSSVPLILSFVGAREMIWKFQTRKKSLCCVLIIIAARERRQNGKTRGRSSNSSSPSSASSLGCRGGWENIAFFLKFPSNHRSLSLFEIPINRHVVLPPDIAKCLPKNRLLNEVRFIELRFVVFSRSFFPTVVLSAEEEEEDVLFSSLLFPCVLKICDESDDERRRIEILTKTSFSHSKTQNNRRNGED